MIKKCNFASVKYKQWSSTKVYKKTNNKLKRKQIRRYVNTYNIQWTIKLSIWCGRKIRVLENQIRKITIYYFFSFILLIRFSILRFFLCLQFFLRFQLVKSKSEKKNNINFSSNFRFPSNSFELFALHQTQTWLYFGWLRISSRRKTIDGRELIWLSSRILFKFFMEFFLSTHKQTHKMIDTICVISFVKWK